MTLRDGIIARITDEGEIFSYEAGCRAADAIIALFREAMTSDGTIEAAIVAKASVLELDDKVRVEWETAVRKTTISAITAALDVVLEEDPRAREEVVGSS